MPTIRQRVSSAWRGLRFAGASGWMAGPYGLWPLLSYNPDDYAVTIDDLPSSSAVMACVQWIMRTFPQAPAVIRQIIAPGQDEAVADHPLTELLALPNPYYSGDLLMQATAMSFCIAGNAYWLVMRDGMGVDRELWFEPPDTIRPHFPEDGSEYIDYYEVMRNGKWDVQVPPRDVIHFQHGIDPTNGRLGFPPLQAALREVFTDQEAALYTSSLLHNTGVPSVVISPTNADARVSNEQLDQIKQSYQERFTGENRGLPLVMRGPTKVDILTFSPEAMNLDRIRQFCEARIAGLLGIPAIVAGLEVGIEHATYANFSEARRQAWDDCIIPIQTAIGRAMTVQLLPDYSPPKGMYVAFDYSRVPILQEDQNALFTRISQGYTAGWLKRSDARRLAHLPVDDVEDDVYRTDLAAPAAVPALPSGSASEPTPIRAAGQGFAVYRLNGHMQTPDQAHIVEPLQLPAGATTTPTWQYWNAGKKAAFKARVLTKVVADPEWKALRDDLDGIVEDVTPSFTADLTRAFTALGKQAAKEMRLPEKSVESDATVAAIQAVDYTLPLFREAFESAYVNITDDTIAAIADALDTIPTQLTRNDLMRGLRSAQAARLESLSADITGQTARAIVAAVQDGTEAGMNPVAIARQIRQYVSGSHLYPVIAEERGPAAATAYRATVIARTESAWGRNLSTVAAYESSQIVTAIRVYDGEGCGWSSHDDSRKANGLVVTFDEARQTPISHPNCVRGFAPEIVEGE
jgi:HK97 family phage portal protein